MDITSAISEMSGFFTLFSPLSRLCMLASISPLRYTSLTGVAPPSTKERRLTMQQTELQLLTDAYNRYKDTNMRGSSIRFTNMSPIEKREITDSLALLEEYGYIRLTARASGFWQFALTVKGIKFAENGYKEPEPAPLFKGDNSIFINGSQNTVSNNYNEISVDVSSSDLPDDCKKLIEELLYELKNPYITPEKKSNVINKFLTDISSGAISGTAATGLTFLLKSLFSHIGL